MFKVIPVIDLYNDVVVHAKHGQREAYRPIQSLLTPSHQPIDIIQSLLAVYPFEQLYIADLNAIIDGDTRHENLIKHIQEVFPKLSIWLDQGNRTIDDMTTSQSNKVRPVIGTENIQQLSDYEAILSRHHNICLSLDFLADGYKGPSILRKAVRYWPQHVIAMSLPNVGSNQGVNYTLLKDLLAKRTSQKIYAAGGVRNGTDLKELKVMGVNGALIASALHNKQISAQTIRDISQ